MDLQALVQLVSEYRPVEGCATSRSSLLSAVHQLRAALAGAEQVGEGLRPVVKALVTASAHAPEEWDNILQALRGLLANTAVPWLHRAFLLKSLPAMLVDAPTAQQRQHGDALCGVLAQWSVPPHGADGAGDAQDTPEESSQCTGPQEQRVARTALLSLPPAYATSIVEHLVSRLPHSLSACVALVSNPSAHAGLKKAFEAWLSQPSASPHTSCVAEIEKTLKEHFPGYGATKYEQLCARFIARGPLKSAAELEALQEELRALEEMDASHRSIVGSQISLTFLFTKIAEVLDIVYSPQRNCLLVSMADCSLPLSVIQSLLQLTEIASMTCSSVSPAEMRKVSACLLSIDSADAALDAPLPLVECVLYLVLRTLPCMSTKDDGTQPFLEELTRAINTLSSVAGDAALKIQSFLPALCDEANAAKTSDPENATGTPRSAEEAHQNAAAALRVAQTVTQLCRVGRRRFWGDAQGEESARRKLERIAAAARGVTFSWRREKSHCQQKQTELNARRAAAGPGGARREAQGGHHQPRRGDRGGAHQSFKRRRREAFPL